MARGREAEQVQANWEVISPRITITNIKRQYNSRKYLFFCRKKPGKSAVDEGLVGCAAV